MKYTLLSLLKNRPLSAMFLLVNVVSLFAEDDRIPLLVLTPPGELFSDAVNGMKKELEEDFVITVLKKPKEDGGEDIERYFSETRPEAVVIVGNRLLRTYDSCLKKHPDRSAIPVVSIYALDTERALRPFVNATGISCQTPMVTAVARFRGVVDKPVKTVGVIYRHAFKDFVKKHTRLCSREKITVKSIMIGNERRQHKKEIRKALEQLLGKENVDAVWIPNDNVILTSQLLEDVWLPVFRRSRVPVIVGVEVLVRPELDFGTFAVIPDATGTGIQAANLIFDLMDEGWKTDGVTVQPTLSVFSVLNWKKAKRVYNAVDTKEVNKVFGR